jgi:ribosomal protein S18 acetylase RimI-like enzyme
MAVPGKLLQFRRASNVDAVELAALHTAVAQHLTGIHGAGPWSAHTTEKGVLFAMRHSYVMVLQENRTIIATLRLANKKPWAIDTGYFTKCRKPVYLLAMAVAPTRQRHGIGRKCLDQARQIASTLDADAIRLDAYNASAGAGGFYERCGFTEMGRVTYRKAPLIYFELLLL